jgi:hypothetical protein
MMNNPTEFVLTGIDVDLSNEGATNRRMVCHIQDDGRIGIWGRDGNTKHITTIETHGFPCTISCMWREPHSFERNSYGCTHVLDEDAEMRIL